jgi:hypothetical protein
VPHRRQSFITGLFGYVQHTPERMEQSKWQKLAAQTTSCLLKMKKEEDHKLLSNQAALSNSEHSYYKIKRL